MPEKSRFERLEHVDARRGVKFQLGTSFMVSGAAHSELLCQ